MVAVWMVTYNHGEFIENAIESVMMQKSTFKYKLFIGEDNSTDKTREICKKLQEKYTDRIELILHEKNIGANSNGMYMYKRCLESGSKYIALLEGDDFWTDPNKLQKQVDFLEQNLNYSICFTNLNLLINNNLENSDINQLINSKKNHSASLENFLSPYVWYTPTCVFRNVVNFNKVKALLYDTSIFSILLKYGNAYLINDVTSVYRIHNQGTWSMKSKLYKLKLNTKIFKSMAYFHNGKVKLINESFLWGVIDIIRNQESKFQDKFIHMFQFLFFCFYKPKYFPLFWKELIKLKLTKIMK